MFDNKWFQLIVIVVIVLISLILSVVLTGGGAPILVLAASLFIVSSVPSSPTSIAQDMEIYRNAVRMRTRKLLLIAMIIFLVATFSTVISFSVQTAVISGITRLVAGLLYLILVPFPLFLGLRIFRA